MSFVQIRAIHIRNYRSVQSTSVEECGRLNVFIGKNNAGKSNILTSIKILLDHLRGGAIASPWPTERPAEDFTDRDLSKSIQIGITFDFPRHLNEALRKELLASTPHAPHAEKAIEQVSEYESLSFIVTGVSQGPDRFLYVEHLGVGGIHAEGNELRLAGISLLKVPLSAATELHARFRDSTELKNDLEALRSLDDDNLSMLTRREGIPIPYVLTRGNSGREVRQSLITDVTELVRSAGGELKTLKQGIGVLTEKLQAESNAIDKQELQHPLRTFSGEASRAPRYALGLMSEYGRISLLRLQERKMPIGRNEAEELLRLKVRRGGTERLRSIQNVVQNLLGVSVDAFESEPKEERRPTRRAEMDIDEFLVEANGAGIREALRIILDLELKTPQLLLVEEPEVHLHPGLEYAVQAYLRLKSREIQMFVTTHSTAFIDSLGFSNVYLVSRDAARRTSCKSIDSSSGPRILPAELGMRLSTLFMFDRLVFVEGPSDESILRELATKLGLDLTQANVGFVQMGGVRNFAHYAAESTLTLLSRRQVRMWFVVDRDERDDEEVASMLARIGDRAKLWVLQRRELENYLLAPSAVLEFLRRKLSAAHKDVPIDEQELSRTLQAVAADLREEVIRLRLESKLLPPIFLQRRNVTGDLTARIAAGRELLEARLAKLPLVQADTESELARIWPTRALEIAPGALILEGVAHKYGAAFSKENGDSVRLAQLVAPDSIPEELQQLLQEFTGISNKFIS
jgi:putative ATP-dependent endonuclease of OLD family